MNKLTYERLKELLHYDPITGLLTRVVDKHYNALKGDVVGCKSKATGYKYVSIDNVLYKTSRLAWLYMKGYFPEHQVDHENHIRDDDRWENLRHLTNKCNSKNCLISKNNSSGLTGVYFHRQRNKWASRIMVDGKNKSLGLYEDFNDAACARLMAEQCLNWDGCDSNTPAFQYVQKMLGRQ